MRDLNSLYKVMDSGDVKRYHTVATLGSKLTLLTVGVWRFIALYLYPEIDKGLLLNTLLHDVGEIDTGDIPATVKWANPELKHRLDAIEDKLMQELGIDYKITTKEKKILKQADMFELLFFCLKQRKLGNRHVGRIFGNGVEKLSDGNLNGRGEKLLANLVTLYGEI